MKKRIEWLDNLRGLAIIIVVIGHMPIDGTLLNFIYSFHVPLFFIISGISYGLSTKTDISYKDFVKGKVKRLLIPYFLLNIFVLPIWYIDSIVLLKSDTSILTVLKGVLYSNQVVYPMPSNVTWFISFLFILIVVFKGIEMLTKQNNKKTFIIVFLLGLIGTILSIFNIKIYLPYHLQTMLIGIVFFYLGVIYIRNMEKIGNFIKKDYLKYIIAIIFTIIGTYFGLKNGKVSMHINSYHNELYFYLSSILISWALIIFMKQLPKLKSLTYIGTNTLIYVALHCPIMRFLKYVSEPTAILVARFPILTGILIIIVILPISYLVNKYIPFLIGNKKNK